MSCCEAFRTARCDLLVTATCHYGYSVGFLRCAKPVRPMTGDAECLTIMIGTNDAGLTLRPLRHVFSPLDRTVAEREGVLDIPGPLPLHFGGRLSDVRIAWRLTGNLDGPVVVALGGISAGRYVAAAEGTS